MRKEIDSLLKEAMLNKDKVRVEVLRAIKTAFMNWRTSADNIGKELTDADEVKILLKMKSQREDSIAQYKVVGRNDLVESETNELNVLLEYIPAQTSEEDIINATKEIANEIKEANGSVSMKDMKTVLSKVQAKYPTANGKIVSDVLKSMI